MNKLNCPYFVEQVRVFTSHLLLQMVLHLQTLFDGNLELLLDIEVESAQRDHDIINAVKKDGTTVLLVEQNAKKALSVADRGYVLETGNIVLEGKASDLLNNEDIKKAYLGE